MIYLSCKKVASFIIKTFVNVPLPQLQFLKKKKKQQNWWKHLDSSNKDVNFVLLAEAQQSDLTKEKLAIVQLSSVALMSVPHTLDSYRLFQGLMRGMLGHSGQ